jgi:hypothetical protein
MVAALVGTCLECKRRRSKHMCRRNAHKQMGDSFNRSYAPHIPFFFSMAKQKKNGWNKNRPTRCHIKYVIIVYVVFLLRKLEIRPNIHSLTIVTVNYSKRKKTLLLNCCYHKNISKFGKYFCQWQTYYGCQISI